MLEDDFHKVPEEQNDESQTVEFVKGLCYTVKQSAAALNVSERMIQKQIYEGKLGAFKVGRRLMVSHEQLQDYIKKNTLRVVPVVTQASAILRKRK